MVYYIGKEREFTDSTISMSTISELLEYFKNKKEIGVDTETTGYDPHTNDILSIQFGTHEDQFVVNCKEIPLYTVKSIFEQDSLFLFQNAKFDLKYLMKDNIYPKNIYDTFLAELVLNTGIERGEQRLGLDDLTWKYCDVKLDKTIRGNINREGLSERVIKYAADDTKYLSIIKQHQQQQIEQWQLQKVIDLENEVVKVFAQMEYDGVSLNEEKWKDISKLTSAKIKELEASLDTIVTEDDKLRPFVPNAVQTNLFGFAERKVNINWSSSQQKQDILKALGIVEDSTGDRILQRNKNKHRLIPILIEYNKYKKLNDAFGKAFLGFINKKTKRIHPDIWPILSTGRIAVSKPNLNQIPSKGELGEKIRSCFIPQEGYKIVGGDYSGFELRVIAEYSQDPVWLEAFNTGGDLHSILCSKTFNIPLDKVKEPFPPKPDLKYRDVQKTVNFGLAYGMSHYKLADTIQVPEEEAKTTINKFFKAVPKVKTFLNLLGNLGKERGFIRSGGDISRVRWFPKWILSQDKSNKDRFKILGEIERASMNSPIQGTNANVIKLALINVYKEIKQNNWPVKILLSVYDEIQTECREDKAEEWKVKLEEIMINSAKEFIKTIPVLADCHVSDYWTK
jgi:DNA polymerase-1